MRNLLLSFIALFFLTQCNKTNDLPPAPVALNGLSVAVNIAAEYQDMDGFGASDAWRCQFVGKNWPVDKRDQIADLLFSQEDDASGNPKGIGLSIWRFNIGAGSSEQGSASNITDMWRRAECFLNADGSYDWTKQAGQQWFMQAAKKRGVEKLLGFTNSAPVHLTSNGKAYSPTGFHYNIKDGYMDKYADFLATVAEHFKNANLNLDYISPFNEPQWGWDAPSGTTSQEGSPASNGDMAQLSKLLSAKITSKGLNSKIAIGEAGAISYMYETKDADRGNQIYNFFNAASPNYIGNQANVEKLISSHSYWSVWPVSSMVSSRQDLWSKIQSTDPKLKYWESEYCILENSNDDMSGGATRDLSMKTALYVSRIIHYDLTIANASSWQWWTALTTGNYKDGLVYLDNGDNTGGGSESTYCMNDGYVRESKLLWALGNYSRFIRPGMKRIQASTSFSPGADANSVMTSAFKDPITKKLVIVMVNNGYSSKKIVFDFKGLGLVNDELTAYETSASYSLKKTGTFKTADIQLSKPSSRWIPVSSPEVR